MTVVRAHSLIVGNDPYAVQEGVVDEKGAT